MTCSFLIAPELLYHNRVNLPDRLISVSDRLHAFADQLNPRLDQFLYASLVAPPLRDAIRYAALAPGKRLRPFLVVECCRLAKGSDADAWPIAAAIECIHAFSLVHDDLPAMDNDDFRRGQPTVHKKFGEAIAILTGDALLALTFEIVATNLRSHPRIADIVSELANAAGGAGMIGGQALDILSEEELPDLSKVVAIHERKTARLFAASCKLGAYAANTNAAALALTDFGHHLGLAFQIADDLLDATSSSQVLGKKAGKDHDAGKQTYTRCVGVEASRTAGGEAVARALEALKDFDESADLLRGVAKYAMERTF